MEELRVEANGIGFGALAWGDPGAPLALLLHGYPDTAWTWRHLGPHLAERGWRAVAPFTRGYAPTDLAPDDRYLVADLARDALALHAALGGDDRAVLIGHDWGAITAEAVAAAEPDRFAAHVTLAVPPMRAMLRPLGTLAGAGLAARQTRASWYIAFNQLPGAERTLDRLIPWLWRAWSPGYDGVEDSARCLAALDTPARRRAALRYYRDNFRRGARALFTGTPRAPMLFLHGEDDGCLLPEFGTRFPETLPTGSRHERLEGVGHFLHLEDPERVNAAIADWIAA